MNDQSSDSETQSKSASLEVIEGGRDELEQLLVNDLFRPDGDDSKLDDLAKRLRPRATKVEKFRPDLTIAQSS